MPTSFVEEGRRLATSPVTTRPMTKRRKVDVGKKMNVSKTESLNARVIHPFIHPSSKYMVNSFLGTRYESINRYFRESQKSTEKGLLIITTIVKKMITSAQNGTINVDASLEKLEMVEKRLNDMEKQLLHTKDLHDVNIQKLTSRCDLLCKTTKSSEGYDAFLEEHLNTLIADYVCRSGQIKAAKLFASLHNVDKYLDFDIFEELESIVDSLRQRRTCKELLEWCASNRSKLRKEGIYIEMECRVHAFSQLCISENKADAVAYALKHFSSTMKALDDGEKTFDGDNEINTSESKMINISKKAMGLLVFKDPLTCGIPKYTAMVSDGSWERLINLFRSAWCVVNRIPNESRLASVLRVGLAVLKTAICKPNVQGHTGGKRKRTGDSLESSTIESALRRNSGAKNNLKMGDSNKSKLQASSNFSTANCHARYGCCPACDEHLGAIAACLPRAHKSQSMLICRISGDTMDESNPPLAFPNGQVYSSNAITKMAFNGAIKCPVSGLTCKVDELRKVFIL